MLTRQRLFDIAPAVALVLALGIVFAVDSLSRPSPERELGDGDEPETKRSLLGTNQPLRRKHAPRPDSIYAERTAENREEVVKKRGGSPISEQAVQSGLDWLARHQAQDGSWSRQCLTDGPMRRCEKKGELCGGPGEEFTIAHTGLTLLAFQGGGHFWFNETPYSAQVKRGLDWLIANQQQNGQFANPTRIHAEYYMYEHAIATFALAEACALAKHSDEQPDRKHQEALTKAIKFIVECQDTEGGGWRYTPKQAGDSSVSGWVVLALKSAQAADVKIDENTLSKCISFFKGLELPEGRSGYTVGANPLTEATTGVGMLVHHFLLEKSDSPLVKDAAVYLARYAASIWGADPNQKPDYYLWYNCTLGMYLAGGDNWDKWNTIVREAVLRLQAKNGCERGSWPPSDQWSGAGGRIYSTALAILTLEVYYRFAKKDKTSNQQQSDKK